MARHPAPPQPQRHVLSIQQKRRGIERLQKRIEDLEAFDPQTVQKRFPPEVTVLGTAIDETLATVFGHATVEYDRYKSAARLDNGLVVVSLGREFGSRSEYQDTLEARQYLAEGKQKALALLRQAVRGLEEEIDEESTITNVPVELAFPEPSPLSKKVFIVHGHDPGPRAEVARFVEKLGFEAVILHERPNKGRTIITKFREEAADIGFAVVVMTPDDLGKPNDASEAKLRARQNVVFELGFFIGALGPERVAAMVKGDIERPSDFDGVVYISLDKDDWPTKLGQELQAAGYEIEWNKVMRP
jgi:predicted nucleotide-binding protein